MTALAQTSPGPIAVNAAILVGWKVSGLGGMLAAVLGTVIPPVAILSVISLFYGAFAANPYVAMVLDGMQAGVAAVILDVVCSLGGSVMKKHSLVHDAIIVGAFLATFFPKINVICIILAAGLLGIGMVWLRKGEMK